MTPAPEAGWKITMPGLVAPDRLTFEYEPAAMTTVPPPFAAAAE